MDYKNKKICALLSVPRLGFIQNMASVLHLAYMGIPVAYNSGALWEKSLSKGLEDLISMGMEHVLVCDYDSIFTDVEVNQLFATYLKDKSLDALVPRQVHQHEDRELPYHFGMTIINLKKLAKMPKPWFKSGTGMDSDMYFWSRWQEAGNTVYISKDITIGHLAEVVRWPTIDGAIMQTIPEYLENGKEKYE